MAGGGRRRLEAKHASQVPVSNPTRGFHVGERWRANAISLPIKGRRGKTDHAASLTSTKGNGKGREAGGSARSCIIALEQRRPRTGAPRWGRKGLARAAPFPPPPQSLAGRGLGRAWPSASAVWQLRLRVLMLHAEGSPKGKLEPCTPLAVPRAMDCPPEGLPFPLGSSQVPHVEAEALPGSHRHRPRPPHPESPRQLAGGG